MVDRRAQQRQAERHVHCLAEGRVLQRRQALVVVHREHDVRIGQLPRREYRVGRPGPGRGDPGALRPFDRRPDHFDLLATQVSAFAGVRIQAADRDPRCVDPPEATQVAVEDRECHVEQFAADCVADGGQRQMRRRERDTQRSPASSMTG